MNKDPISDDDIEVDGYARDLDRLKDWIEENELIFAQLLNTSTSPEFSYSFPLKQGGMSRVMFVEFNDFEGRRNKVAMKINFELNFKPAVEAVDTESQILKKVEEWELEDPPKDMAFVPRLLFTSDSTFFDSTPCQFIVMEYFHGYAQRDLDDKFDTPVADKFGIYRLVSRRIDWLARNGIYNMDLNRRNILGQVSDNNQPLNAAVIDLAIVYDRKLDTQKVDLGIRNSVPYIGAAPLEIEAHWYAANQLAANIFGSIFYLHPYINFNSSNFSRYMASLDPNVYKLINVDYQTSIASQFEGRDLEPLQRWVNRACGPYPLMVSIKLTDKDRSLLTNEKIEQPTPAMAAFKNCEEMINAFIDIVEDLYAKVD